MKWIFSMIARLRGKSEVCASSPHDPTQFASMYIAFLPCGEIRSHVSGHETNVVKAIEHAMLNDKQVLEAILTALETVNLVLDHEETEAEANKAVKTLIHQSLKQ